MRPNLLSEEWADVDSAELRILLDQRIGGPGQIQGRADYPSKFYLPLAGESCRIALTFRDKKLVAIQPGPAFDAAEWERIKSEVEEWIRAAPTKVGREFSFSGLPVVGSWRGSNSGVQILPPPPDAPRANMADAAHPFILEFPLRTWECWQVTNRRRQREHRKLTLLLNVLLARGTSLQPNRRRHFWAHVPRDGAEFNVEWVSEFFFAKLGDPVIDQLSAPAGEQIPELDAEAYYGIAGLGGDSLRVPSDLDDSICCYMRLSKANAEKFDRATFWLDLASHQWPLSISASFASLVSAVEALTGRGQVHSFDCPTCGGPCQHEVPGATERFRAFLEQYAAGESLRTRRTQMYALRSGILHGSSLMQIDQDRAFGWDPPGLDERELHNELWSLTRIALRNWLRNPGAAAAPIPHEHIAVAAYYIWQKAGCPFGSDQEHWFAAIEELRITARSR